MAAAANGKFLVMTRFQTRVCSVMLVLAVLGGCSISPQARRDKYLARGKALLQKHDYSRAILEFRNAAKAMPKDAEPYYEIGVASEGAGDIRTAVAFFKKTLDENPKHPGAQLKLAQLMAITNDRPLLQDAESRLNTLKQTAAASPDVLYSLALTELKLGKTDRAVEDLQQSLATAPTGLKSSILLAQARLWQHDGKGAEEILRKACEAAPRSAEPRVVLGEFYVIQRRTPEAEAEFQRALAIDPKNGPALTDLANLERSLGRKQEAEQTFRRLAESGEERFQPVFAQFLFEEGRRSEAVQEFERVAKQNPGNRLARTDLVAAYRAVDRTADAQKVLDAALGKNPKDLDALLQRAEIFLALRKYGQADTDLNEVLRLRPNSAEAHYIRAQLYRAQEQSLTYRQELSEALRLNPYFLRIRLELAQNLTENKQAPAALEILDATPADQRQLTPVIVQRNWALWTSGDLAQMRKGINEGLSHERSPDLVVQDGLLRLRTGDPSGARSALEEALKISPENVKALSGLGQSYLAQKQPAMALEKVKEYASRQPKSAPVQQFLGTMLLSHGDREEARAAFAAAKAADPHFVDADLSLVQVDVLDGKIDDARKKLEQILSADSSNKTASLWLANAEAMKGDYSPALAQYRKAVEANPDNAEALNDYAYLLGDYGQHPDDALKYAQKAVELAPDKPEYRDTLGWVLYRKGLYPLAVAELERAAAQGDSTVWKYHLAMAYIKAGDLNRGRLNLDSALKRNPNLPEAKQAQELLSQAK